MNTKAILSVALMAVIILSATVLSSPTDAEDTSSDDTGVSKTYTAPSGSNLKNFIIDTMWSDGNIIQDHDGNHIILRNLTVVLEEGGEYTFTREYTGDKVTDAQLANVNTFSGDTLTIIGNHAIVMTDDGSRFNGSAVSGVDVSLYISNLNFESTAGSSSLEMRHYQNMVLTGCSFTDIVLTIGSTNKYTDLRMINCDFIGETVSSESYALAAECSSASIVGCSFEGFSRDINMKARLGSSNVTIEDTVFDGQGYGPAIQLGESNATDIMDYTIEGCTFRGFSIAVNIHKVSNGTGSLDSNHNEYSDCQFHFMFELKDDGSMSDVEVSSVNDRFENDGVTTSKPIITDDLGNDVSERVDVIDPVEDPQQPPVIWDDDDDYVPIPPVVYDDSGDDDTVTIVACAAAAVVAAIMAVFLIVERKR